MEMHSKQDAVRMADFASSATSWQTQWNTYRLWFWFICSIMWKHDVIHKTEVCNILHSRHSRTKRQPRTTCMENLVIFGPVIF